MKKGTQLRYSEDDISRLRQTFEDQLLTVAALLYPYTKDDPATAADLAIDLMWAVLEGLESEEE